MEREPPRRIAFRRKWVTKYIWLCLALSGCSCSDAVDRVAKKRVFSPEDPPKIIATSKEELSPDKLDEDPGLSRRVLAMGAAETTERIGPHLYTAAITFEWSLDASQSPPVKLFEKRTLRAGEGGVSGNFHASSENSNDQGLEIIRVEGKVFAKSRYGRFRQRLRDRGIAEQEREEIYGGLRTIDELFLGRLGLKSEGPVSQLGRTAFKYSVTLVNPVDDNEARSVRSLPKRAMPKEGADLDSSHRMVFEEKRRPRSLRGELIVDSETGVVLKAHLEGRIEMSEGRSEASLSLKLDSGISEVGKAIKWMAPPDFLPDEDKPQGIADALDRFGIPRTGKQKTKSGDAEPSDTSDDSQ